MKLSIPIKLPWIITDVSNLSEDSIIAKLNSGELIDVYGDNGGMKGVLAEITITEVQG